MKEVVISNPVRTAIGSFGGALKTVPAYDLARIIMQRIVADSGVEPGRLNEVIFGNIGQPSEAANIARVSALYAGIPEHVPAYTVQRNCASGMESMHRPYNAIQAEDGDLYMVGGTENMSAIPYMVKGARWGLKLRHSEFTDALWEGLTDPTCNLIMGGTAENVAERCGVTREEQDQYAVQSHKKAFMATRMGKFKDEIVPVEVVKKAAGQEVAKETITQDESINPGLTVQKAALYPTVFKKGGTVTPANACPMNDGAAGMLLSTAETAEKLGLKPMARILGFGFTGVDPGVHGHRPRDRAAKGAQAGRDEVRPAGPGRDQRGVCGAGARRGQDDAVGRTRLGLREDQRERRRHCARPPGRRIGRAHRGVAAARDGATERALRRRDAVRGRRPGRGRHRGADLGCVQPQALKEGGDVYLKAAVVGAGTMGGEIAQVISFSGLPVILKDVNQEMLDKGMETIRQIYQGRVDKGKMSAGEMESKIA